MQREGATCRNSTVSSDSILKLVISDLISDILIVLSTVNLQSQGQCVSISLRPVLGITQGGEVYVMVTVWSPCNYLLPPGVGFSMCETAQRT